MIEYYNCDSECNLTLDVILFTKNESLASLEYSETLAFGFGALELEYDLFGLLGLLSEDWLGLSSEPFLLHVISSLSLSCFRSFTCLVLRNFVKSVFLCFFTVAFKLLWNMNHFFLFSKLIFNN